MELRDPGIYEAHVQAEIDRPWQMRLYDRIREEQETQLLDRTGGRFGILVHNDRYAREWRRLERLRGRVLMWINWAFKDSKLKRLRGIVEP